VERPCIGCVRLIQEEGVRTFAEQTVSRLGMVVDYGDYRFKDPGEITRILSGDGAPHDLRQAVPAGDVHRPGRSRDKSYMSRGLRRGRGFYLTSCEKCGAGLAEDSHFCSKCGVRTPKGKKENARFPWQEALADAGDEIDKALSEAGEEIRKGLQTAREEIRKSTADTVTCSKCGKESFADSKFCWSCGKEIK
jgi:uncharacterized OB-fold protein